MHGAHNFGSFIEPRQLTASIGIPNQATISDVQVIVRKIASMLLDQYGKPKEVTLKYDYEPDKHYKAKFSGSININRILDSGIFPIPFTAYDPYAYSNVFSDEITWGSEVITFESNYLLGHEGTAGMVDITSPQTINVTVAGYALKPIFEISGSADSLIVTNDGQSFSLPSFSNTDWVIDCERYTVTKNGVNAFGETGLREFWLHEGNNAVQISGSNINISIRIKFRDKWM